MGRIASFLKHWDVLYEFIKQSIFGLGRIGGDSVICESSRGVKVSARDVKVSKRGV